MICIKKVFHLKKQLNNIHLVLKQTKMISKMVTKMIAILVTLILMIVYNLNQML